MLHSDTEGRSITFCINVEAKRYYLPRVYWVAFRSSVIGQFSLCFCLVRYVLSASSCCFHCWHGKANLCVGISFFTHIFSSDCLIELSRECHSSAEVLRETRCNRMTTWMLHLPNYHFSRSSFYPNGTADISWVGFVIYVFVMHLIGLCHLL